MRHLLIISILLSAAWIVPNKKTGSRALASERVEHINGHTNQYKGE